MTSRQAHVLVRPGSRRQVAGFLATAALSQAGTRGDRREALAAETSGARDCGSIQVGELLPGEHQPGGGDEPSPGACAWPCPHPIRGGKNSADQIQLGTEHCLGLQTLNLANGGVSVAPLKVLL